MTAAPCVPRTANLSTTMTLKCQHSQSLLFPGPGDSIRRIPERQILAWRNDANFREGGESLVALDSSRGLARNAWNAAACRICVVEWLHKSLSALT